MAARQHFAAEAIAQATHSSNSTWADLVSLDWTPDASSDYVIFWSYALRNSSNITSDARGKLVHDGADYAINNNDAYNAADYPSFSGLIRHQSGGSPTEINTKVRFQAESNGNVIQAKLGRLVALKLSAADFYAETLSAINHGANTNFEDALVQSITVPSGGRTYLAIASFEQTAGGSTLTCRSRLSSTSAGTASGEFGGCLNDSAGTNPVMLIWRVTLAAGSQDVRLQYSISHTTGGTLTITNRRMVLIELDGLDGEEYANLGTDDTTTSTSYENTPLSLAASISANPQLVFGAWATAASTVAVIGTDLHQDGASLTESVRQSYSNNVARSHGHASVSLLSGHGAGSHSWLLRHKTSTGTGRTKASASIAVLDLGADGGGPATYDETLAETSTADQTATTAATFPNAKSESAAASASESGGLSLDASASEAVASDAAQTAATTHHPPLSETMATAEASSAVATLAPTLTETATVGEASSTSATLSTSALESVTGGDGTVAAAGWQSVRSESVAANDNAIDAADIGAARSEVASAEDNASAIAEIEAALSEGANSVEGTSPASIMLSSLDETASADEESTANVDGGATTYDADLSEEATAGASFAANAYMASARTETSVSTASQAASGAWQTSRTETLAAADTSQGATSIGFALSETATGAAGQIVGTIVGLPIAEAIAANDDQASLASTDDAITESVGAGDGYVGEGGERVPPSEARTIATALASRTANSNEPARDISTSATARNQVTAVRARDVQSVRSAR